MPDQLLSKMERSDGDDCDEDGDHGDGERGVLSVIKRAQRVVRRGATPAAAVNESGRRLAKDAITFLLERSRELSADDDRLAVITRATEVVVNEVTDRVRDMRGDEAVKRFRTNLSAWWR